MKYIKNFKINESKELDVRNIQKEFFILIEKTIFTERVINNYKGDKASDFEPYVNAYLISYISDDSKKHYIIKVSDESIGHTYRDYYLYDTNKNEFIKSGEYYNQKLVKEIIDSDLNIRPLEEIENVIFSISIEDYIKTKEDRNRAFIKLNEVAEQRPHGGGVTLDPKDAKKAHISIDGIYFDGEGFRNREHKSIFDNQCIELCKKINLQYEVNQWGVIEVDTDDIEIYFHPQQTVIKVKTDKVELGEITPWVADEISEFDLPIKVSYFYT